MKIPTEANAAEVVANFLYKLFSLIAQAVLCEETSITLYHGLLQGLLVMTAEYQIRHQLTS
jgi:hypothetical protein